MDETTGTGADSCWAPDYHTQDNLRMFEECVSCLASDTPETEYFVRQMLCNFAGNAPLEVIRAMGQCVIDCRKAELKQEAESN